MVRRMLAEALVKATGLAWDRAEVGPAKANARIESAKIEMVFKGGAAQGDPKNCEAAYSKGES